MIQPMRSITWTRTLDEETRTLHCRALPQPIANSGTRLSARAHVALFQFLDEDYYIFSSRWHRQLKGIEQNDKNSTE